MGKILSDDRIAAYHRDGYAAPVRVMDAGTANAYRRRFEAYEAANGGWYELSKGAKLYLLQTWVAELAAHPRILDAVEDLLGPDLRSEEHTSELQSIMRISYAVFCLHKKHKHYSAS